MKIKANVLKVLLVTSLPHIRKSVYNIPSLHHLNKLLSHDVSTTQSLSHGDQRRQLFISHLLKSTQQTSLEEHLSNQREHFGIPKDIFLPQM